MYQVKCNRCPATVQDTLVGMASITIVNHVPESSGYRRERHLCQSCLRDLWDWFDSTAIPGDGARLAPVSSATPAAASVVGSLS